jgi:hypothetical protein
VPAKALMETLADREDLARVTLETADQLMAPVA